MYITMNYFNCRNYKIGKAAKIQVSEYPVSNSPQRVANAWH